MKPVSISIKGFRSINNSGKILLPESLITIVGKNDAGKSNFVHAMSLFFNDELANGERLSFEDFFRTNTHTDDKIEVEMEFEEPNNHIKLKKIFSMEDKRIRIASFKNDSEIKGATRDGAWTLLPTFLAIPSIRDINQEMKISKTTSLGKLLLPLLTQPDLEKPKRIKESVAELKTIIDQELVDLSKDVYSFLQKQSPEIKALDIFCGNFNVEKAIEPKVNIDDNFGHSCHIERRGAGYQSSFILALMQTYAKRKIGGELILSIEEPELFLHASAQRTMFEALKTINSSGALVVLTTHSPVFIDRTFPEGIFLTQRQKGITSFKQCTNTKSQVQSILGIKNSDILLWEAVIFCEGTSDKDILTIFSEKLGINLEKKHINIVPVGTKGYMEYFAEIKTLKEFGIPFVIFCDKDKDDPEELKKKLFAQNMLNEEQIIITTKREIENYLSERAIREVHQISNDNQIDFNEDADMKKQIKEITGKCLLCSETAKAMNIEEIDAEVKTWIEKFNKLTE